MGESKRRGSREERVAQSFDAKKQKLDAIKKELGLPENAEFLGYLIHLVEKDEFILSVEDTPAVIKRAVTKAPAEAMRFAHFWDAYKYAREEKGEKVVGLFDVAGQFLIKPVL